MKSWSSSMTSRRRGDRSILPFSSPIEAPLGAGVSPGPSLKHIARAHATVRRLRHATVDAIPGEEHRQGGRAVSALASGYRVVAPLHRTGGGGGGRARRAPPRGGGALGGGPRGPPARG